jgi:hypothetical protein
MSLNCTVVTVSSSVGWMAFHFCVELDAKAGFFRTLSYGTLCLIMMLIGSRFESHLSFNHFSYLSKFMSVIVSCTVM